MTELRVISGEGEDAGPPLCKKGPPAVRRCLHRRVTLDTATRKVTCAECGCERDPFEALLTLEANLDRYNGWRERHKREAAQAAAELADVKRQVRNAKAQLRRLSR